MSAKKLSLDTTINAYTIAISCHQKSYKLAFLLNKILDCEFELQEQYEPGTIPFINSIDGHVYYTWIHESERFSLHLINNQGDNNRVLPQMPQIDYLLVITGFYKELNIEKGLKRIKEIPSVLTAFSIETPSLKTRK